MVTTHRLTYRDLLAMPDDGKRYEIIDGELFEMPPPKPKHQEVGFRYLETAGPLIRQGRLGRIYAAPIGVKLAEHDWVEPDIVFVRTAHRQIVGPGYIDGVPDLIVEILSPSNRRHDEVRKLRLYERAGVPEYWLIDLDAESVRVFFLTDDRYQQQPNDGDTAHSQVIPGLAIDIPALFADLW